MIKDPQDNRDDPYETLGVARNCSPREVRNTHLELQTNQPGDYLRRSQARDTLTTFAKRVTYDLMCYYLFIEDEGQAPSSSKEPDLSFELPISLRPILNQMAVSACLSLVSFPKVKPDEADIAGLTERISSSPAARLPDLDQ